MGIATSKTTEILVLKRFRLYDNCNTRKQYIKWYGYTSLDNLSIPIYLCNPLIAESNICSVGSSAIKYLHVTQCLASTSNNSLRIYVYCKEWQHAPQMLFYLSIFH